MPHILEQRLKAYEAMREDCRLTILSKLRFSLDSPDIWMITITVSSEPEGLSWETLERVKVLQEMEQRFASGEYEDSTSNYPTSELSCQHIYLRSLYGIRSSSLIG